VSHAGAIFGWAKPVPVDYRRLRNPRRDMVLVALAGPGMNLLLALLGAAILAATVYFSGGADGGATRLVAANALNFVLINIFLGVFNLLPVPPFDGGHVVQGLLPRPAAAAFARIGRYSLLVMVVLLLVLPQFGVDIVGRLVSPIADAILRFFLGIFGLSL
jgi:Zn-dependent protease